MSFRPDHCPITGEREARLVFGYDAPPAGEIGFIRAPGTPYRREVWQFLVGRHFVSRHAMQVATGYDGAYVDATYRDAATMTATFKRIVALPPERSDNVGRMAAVRDFARRWFGPDRVPHVLDVGAGLGVFPYAVRQAGWPCTAIDPDARAVEHIDTVVGATGLRGDFMKLSATGRFDIVTLNKVLEHVVDPIAMLARVEPWLAFDGLAYIEVPDGEVAALAGPGREEFFIEHLHVFSLASTAIMASQAGFGVQSVTRLREPSGKYTIRAFLARERRMRNE